MLKNTLLITLLTVSFFICKAQSIIKPMGTGEFCENNPDCYEKDTNNEFDKFAGTWKYQNGTSEITIKLKKEEHYQVSEDSNYQDLLVGEYQYIEDGVEKVNTLQDFDNDSISGFEHKISGGIFTHTLPNYCIDNSDISEIKMDVKIRHPVDEFAGGSMILRYVNDNGTEKLQACIFDETTLGDGDLTLDIPDGYYEFIKQ